MAIPTNPTTQPQGLQPYSLKHYDNNVGPGEVSKPRAEAEQFNKFLNSYSSLSLVKRHHEGPIFSVTQDLLRERLPYL